MKSLRAYLLTMALALVLLICAAAALLIREVDRAGRREAEAQLLATARALSTAVDGELRRATSVLITLGASEALRRRDWAALDDQARAALPERDAWVVVFDRQGRQLINTQIAKGAPLPSGTNPKWLWPLLDRGMPRVCNLTRGYVERNIVCVDVPVMENGQARYSLSVIMRPRLFQSIIDRQELRPGHRATLVDQRGIVIWRNFHPERFVGGPVTADMRQSIARSAAGVQESTSLDGDRMLAAFSRSNLSRWTFIVATPIEVIRSGAFRGWSLGLLLTGLFIAVGALLALTVAGRISRSVRKLAGAAARFRDGEFTTFESSGLVEIDDVGRTLGEAFESRKASDERFGLAQEVGGIGAFDWDIPRDEGHVSDSYKDMHGLSHVPGALKLEQVFAAVLPEDLDGYKAQIAAARGGLEPFTIEYRVQHGGGGIRSIAARGRLVPGETGQIVRAVGVVRDVTAEREAAQQLQQLNQELETRVEQRTAELSESERRFRAIFNTSFQLTGLCALDGTVLLVNQAALAAVGVMPEDVCGLRIWDAPWAPTAEEAQRLRESVERAAQGHFVRYTAELQLPEGQRVIDFSLRPILDDAGVPAFLVAEGRDITEQSQAEAALHQAQKMEAVGQLTGGIAHDFNNLLGAVVGALDLIRRKADDTAKVRRFAEAGLEAAERGAKLTGQLLAFSRAQRIELKPVRVRDVVGEMEDLLARTIGPQVRLAFALDYDGVVLSDPTQLELAVLNLAINARDAMPEGGDLTVATAECRIDQDAELSAGRYLVLSIEDNGTGMAPEVAARALDPFFTTKGVGKGTGLGLSQVYGIARHAGGTVRIDSRPGRGTKVQLYLPTTDEAVPRSAEREAEPGIAAERSEATVLVVDDDPDVRGMLVASLDALGYRAVEAHDGPSGLAALDAAAPDLLLLDFAMPGMNGAEVARAVKQLRPDLPIVFASGYSETAAIEAVAGSGAPMLRKPFRVAELQAVLEEALAAATRRGPALEVALP